MSIQISPERALEIHQKNIQFASNKFNKPCNQILDKFSDKIVEGIYVSLN